MIRQATTASRTFTSLQRSISGFTPTTRCAERWSVTSSRLRPMRRIACCPDYSASKLSCSAVPINGHQPGLRHSATGWRFDRVLERHPFSTATTRSRRLRMTALGTRRLDHPHRRARSCQFRRSVRSPSAATVAPLGTVTVSAAVTDGFDLASSNGRSTYSTASNPFQSVGGTNFGPNFDATLVTSGTATVSLPNVYRGLQSTDWTAAGTIMFNTAVPVATMTVKDVGGNFANSVGLPIVTTTAAVNILRLAIPSRSPRRVRHLLPRRRRRP